MEPGQDPLVRYRLRSIRVGVLVTALTILSLFAMLFLPGHEAIQARPFMFVLGAGAAGSLLVVLLPWTKLFVAGIGNLFLYVWSVTDIVLVSVGVGFSGGGHSELFVVYGLTTLFFAATYPPRSQPVLLLFTFASYGTTLAVTHSTVPAGPLFIRFASLIILLILGRFLSRELMQQMTAEAEARTRSERWAFLLTMVSSSAELLKLDPERVNHGAIELARAMGFDAASMCLFDDETPTYRVVAAVGAPEGYLGATYPDTVGISGKVRASGRTVILEDYAATEGGIAIVRDAGFRSAVATPVYVEGRLTGVLAAGSFSVRQVPRQEVEALELLAAHTGLALENARRFEEQRAMVERLTELDRMKSDFLATVSHELRSPVTVVAGAGVTLETMWKKLDEPVRLELLRAMNSNAASLEAMIKNLLDFSQLEAGRTDARFELTDMSILLPETASRLRWLLGGRTLRVDVEPNLFVMADVILLGRVLMNLLSNAAKHTPEGTTVTVSGRATGQTVRIAVEDDGPGIAPDELIHIGERFFRGGDLNTRTRGLGLGLALVGEILELHGGSLAVDSQLGRGSRFSFELRRAAQPLAPRPSRPEPDETSADRTATVAG